MSQNFRQSRILKPRQAEKPGASVSTQRESRLAELENQMMTLLRTTGTNLAPARSSASSYSENQDKLDSLEKQLIQLRATVLPPLATGQMMPPAAADRIQQLESKLQELKRALKAETRARGLALENEENQDQRWEQKSDLDPEELPKVESLSFTDADGGRLQEVRRSRPQRRQAKGRVITSGIHFRAANPDQLPAGRRCRFRGAG